MLSREELAYHVGSLIHSASSILSLSPSGSDCRHGRTRAHILKADATGPRVPAIMGNAEEANHHRLGRRQGQLGNIIRIVLCLDEHAHLGLR